MEVLKITGGVPLKGSVRAAGAKNAITKMLVASLISDKPCTFTNVPSITEVEVTVELCKELGAHISWDRTERVLHIVTKELKTTYIPQRFSGSNRIPILMIGALLGRTRDDIVIPTVGGCNLGKRPVNFHIDALRSLGADIEYRDMKKDGAYFARAHKGLQGCLLVLPHPFNELWYTLLRASLSDDLTLRPKEESGVIVVQKASIPVLQAFFGETIAQEILTLEHGPNRGKKSYIKQDELTPILTAHNFPLAYRSFYTMGAKKGVTHTRKTIDKTHGITTKLSYKIGSGTSSPDATPTSHRSKPHASP